MVSIFLWFWAHDLSEGEAEGGVVGGLPGEGGGDDGVVVAAGGRAVAPVAAWEPFEGIVGQFAEQDGIIEQGEGTALNGESQGFDERAIWFWRW